MKSKADEKQMANVRVRLKENPEVVSGIHAVTRIADKRDSIMGMELNHGCA